MAHVSVCEIDQDLIKQMSAFKFRKATNNAALIMKIDKDKHLVCLDEIIENMGVDQLREYLPEHQPRYVMYCHKLEHTDGRISYPLCFIYATPPDCKPELQMMYAGSKLAVQKEASAMKTLEVRLLEDLTEEWLEEKLGKFS